MRAPDRPSALRADEPGPPASASADIRAVRAFVLPLEPPPSFVFTTAFKNVP
jgi:hypothetical protein